MVAAAAAAPQQQSSTTAEEEALKRNTDCVYFLASPLTCKKGSECEYRHSEYARINPRDCYYWLNGNCSNPKCGFRHPPLDGLLGTQTVVPTGSSFPSSHSAPAPAPATHAPNNSGKQAVPCIFFQKGLCLKGGRCAFLHGLNTNVNKAPQLTAATPANEPPTLKKASNVLQKCTQEPNVRQANVPKAVVIPPQANKPTHKTETALPQTAVGNERNAPPPPSSTDYEFPRYKATNVPPVINGISMSCSNSWHQAHALDNQSFQHGKDTDEFLRESSPGFDVLVDDELRDSDYYRDEDHYGRTRGQEGRDLNSVNEYDLGRSVDCNSLTDMDRETFRDPQGYDSYDHMQGQYAWEQHRASSDRVLVGGSSHQERRSYLKAETQNQIDESDLRYRLSKHRRVNRLRSVVSPDYAPDNQVEEQSHRRSFQRDSHHLSSQESSLSSLLRGRIKLPRRSPVSGSDLQSERELDSGRNWGSVSPGRPQMLHEGRLRDRIKGRVENDYNNGGGNVRDPRMRREIMDEKNAADFAGPKSLSELKGRKNAESKEQQSLGKRKSLEDHHQPEGDLSFDGPMPLSEILKRKRQAGVVTAASSGISSAYMEDNNEGLVGSSNNNAAQSAVSTVSIEVANNKEANTVKEAEIKIEVTRDQPCQLPNASELEAEEGMIGEEGMEDHDLEEDDQYEYEQGDDEGDYTYEEGENAEAEEEYVDDEDGDDFTKKIGVMFS